MYYSRTAVQYQPSNRQILICVCLQLIKYIIPGATAVGIHHLHPQPPIPDTDTLGWCASSLVSAAHRQERDHRESHRSKSVAGTYSRHRCETAISTNFDPYCELFTTLSRRTDFTDDTRPTGAGVHGPKQDIIRELLKLRPFAKNII